MRTASTTSMSLLLGALVLSLPGCDAVPEEARADAPPTATTTATDCDDELPCTWADVPEATRGRAYRVGQLVADLLATTDSIDQVVALLDSLDDITDVTGGELGVRFRVAGARPIWVALPNDSAAFRLSAPLAGRRTSPVQPALLARRRQQGGEPVGVTGQPDSSKRALFLAPFAWESGIYGGSDEEMSNNRYAVDLALEMGDLELGRRISAGQDVGARRRYGPSRVVINAEEDRADVQLDDFTHWDDYDYVFLTTHGQTVARDGVAVTLLYAGHVTGEVTPNHLDPFLSSTLYREALGQPGVEFMFGGRSGMRSGPGHLSAGDIRDCLWQDFVARDRQIRDAAGNLHASESAPGRADGPRCYEDVDPALQVGLTTDFFRAHYPRGVTNTWIMLMACESMAIGDLGDVFTNHRRNRNVAVIGFDRPVSALFVRPVAREFTRMVGAGHGIHAIVDSMRAIYPEDNLVGLILGKRGANAASARLTPGISNPAFGPDIVSLLDARTDAELVDGGTVELVGTPGDGQPDSLRVVRQVALQDTRVAPGDVTLHLEVAGRGTGSDLTPSRPGNAERFFRVAPDASDLGFDVREDERLDLTVVARLPGGSESRWTYRDIGFAGCSWSLAVNGSAHAGRYTGRHAIFMDLGERFAITLGGTGMEGNVITLAIPALAVGETREIAVGMRSGGTHAAFGFLEEMDDNPSQIMLATGDGSAVRGSNGRPIDTYPEPATLTIRRTAPGMITGTLRGRAWAQRTLTDRHLVKPDVALTFSARASMTGARSGRMPNFSTLTGDPCGS